MSVPVLSWPLNRQPDAARSRGARGRPPAWGGRGRDRGPRRALDRRPEAGTPRPFRGRAPGLRGPGSARRPPPVTARRLARGSLRSRPAGGFGGGGRGLAQSCPPGNPGPASRRGPTGPALRANPCPEVTDLDCRFPLPTLFYRLEAPNLGDRMRRWVQAASKQGHRPGAAAVPPGGQPPARGGAPRRQAGRGGRGRLPARVTSSLASFTDWRWRTGQHKNCVALRPPRGFHIPSSPSRII